MPLKLYQFTLDLTWGEKKQEYWQPRVILLFSAFCMLAMDSPSMSPVKKRACLVESIYQHSRRNTIAPSDQFQGIQISAELMRWLLTTIHHCSKLLATVCRYVFPPFVQFVPFAIRHYFLFCYLAFPGTLINMVLFEGLVEGFVL